MTEDTPLTTDGGTDAETSDDVALDPWGSSTVSDYRKLFEQFGIEEFDASEVPDPHYLMRRGVIFGHREYGRVVEAMANDDPFAALSGFMPTGDPHIGHKLVFDELIWHQEQGGDTYGLIADLEAHSARGMSWDEIDEHARDYILSLLALGFDAEEGELYRQSDNRVLQDLAFELGSKANFSEFEAIYGFGGETNVSHMQSVVTQMADILYPQLDEPKPTVIPVGPDQDPHVRFSRDVATRMRFFKVTEAFASFEADAEELPFIRAAYDALAGTQSGGEGDALAGTQSGGEGDALAGTQSGGDDDAPVEGGSDGEQIRCEDAAEWLAAEENVDTATAVAESAADIVDAAAPDDAARTSAVGKLRAAGKEPLRPRVRFLDRNASEAAFDALVEAIPGEKRRYDEHIDSFELSTEDAEELAREIEIDHGGYGFYQPSSIYHRFMTGLTGGKMSSSVPASHISLLDDPEDGYDKVKSAATGGRATAEEQRRLGGEPDECPVYELYAYLLAQDDDAFATRVYEECAGGERLCGGCKEQAAELMREFLADHQEKREEAEELLEDLDIDLDTDRRGLGGEEDEDAV